MILYKNRLVFGVIKKIVSTFFKALYTVISILNLQFTLLVVVVGGILYFTGALNSEGIKIIFLAFAGLSVVYAVVVTFIKLFGLNKKVVKRKETPPEKVKEKEPEREIAKQPEIKIQGIEEPKYFRVKQNPNMVMAEYGDRYELFDVTDGTMKKIRTDYK